MGQIHALALHNNPGAQIIGRINRSPRDLHPDLVVIATQSDSHAIRAKRAGAHVFVEKPLATTVADAERVVATAHATTPRGSA